MDNDEQENVEELKVESTEEQGTPPEAKEDYVPRDDFNKVYKRAKEAEAKLKSYKQGSKSPDAPAKTEEELEEVVHLRTSGYSREEVERMKVFAKGSGKKLSEVSTDPFILAGIETMRAKSKSEGATPPPSGRPAVAPVSNKSFTEMSAAEREQNFNAIKQKYSRTGGRSNE